MDTHRRVDDDGLPPVHFQRLHFQEVGCLLTLGAQDASSQVFLTSRRPDELASLRRDEDGQFIRSFEQLSARRVTSARSSRLALIPEHPVKTPKVLRWPGTRGQPGAGEGRESPSQARRFALPCLGAVAFPWASARK